jgi:type VI secretion system FHA domain protein
MSGALGLAFGIIRAPAGVAAGSRTVTGGRFAIGRGTGNDWTLPDPDRSLSKLHCAFELQDNAWLVTDTSSNGTSLNGKLLEPGVPRMLRDGDQLAFGPYEIEAHLGAPPDWAGRDLLPPRSGPERNFTDDRLTSDPFSFDEGDALEAAQPAVGLPGNFDPLVSGRGTAPYTSIASDHVPDLNQSFRPPRSSFEVLPEDWDAGIDLPTPAPQAQGALTQRQPAPEPLAETVPLPQPANPGMAAAGFAALAAGAGLSGATAADPDAALRALGAGFRALVSGLRQALLARAAIKGEFRIDQTMIRAAGNNPLKFSADDDDAMAGLLGAGRQAGMTPDQAISEALRDMRRHELAVASAMQRAVRDVLHELDPAPALRRAGSGLFGNLLGRRKRRAWDDHCERYSQMAAALSDNFDSVFGKAFARAYETAMAETASQDWQEFP